jgi:hypothetical protein
MWLAHPNEGHSPRRPTPQSNPALGGQCRCEQAQPNAFGAVAELVIAQGPPIGGRESGSLLQAGRALDEQLAKRHGLAWHHALLAAMAPT